MERNWNMHDSPDNASVKQKIQQLQKGLTDWNQNVFGYIDNRKSKINQRLQQASSIMATDKSFQEIKNLKAEQGEIEYQQEIMWKQRSRV